LKNSFRQAIGRGRDRRDVAMTAIRVDGMFMLHRAPKSAKGLDAGAF